MNKKKIISLDIGVAPYHEFVTRIIELGNSKTSSCVCAANVHMVIEAFSNREFAKHVNGADIVTPDGMPLVKSLKLLYGIKQDRVAGMDLMPDILRAAEEQKLSVYFYGSTPEVLAAINNRIQKDHPNLQIAGSFSPPFRELSDYSKEVEIVEQINDSGDNIVFFSLGCPKQESWMAKNKGKIHAVMLGVGGAFPVYAGMRKRAPKWMRGLSLEWLYRLSQEPGRLFWRYCYTNTLFMVLLIRELVSRSSDKG